MNINVLDFGAKGDNKTDDTKALQKAIDSCNATGGGTVTLPGGHIFRAGTVILKSNVELHLEKTAVLKASDHLEDFDLLGTRKKEYEDKRDVPSYENCEFDGLPTLFFIYGLHEKNVSITGEGEIDGNEEIFYGEVLKEHIEGSFYPRVPLMYIEDVEHFNLRGVTLSHSGFWTVHLVGCRDVEISSIRILNNLRMANCDGIDPDHCQNVRISNCHIEAGDDGIVFKNTAQKMEYGNCENITVSNCTIISTSAAIKFGSESEAPFRNMTISNVAISKSNRGISLMLRDKGLFENIVFSNITIDTRLFSKDHWWGQAEPIAITALKRKEDTDIKYIRGIIFSNIFCTSENGIFIYGEEGTPIIDDIVFDHVRINLVKKTKYESGYSDRRPSVVGGHLETGVNGIFARNVGCISLNDFKVNVCDELQSKFVKEVNIL